MPAIDAPPVQIERTATTRENVFDLATVKPAEPGGSCRPGRNGEIVVCAANDREKYRVRPLPDTFREDPPPVAEKEIAPGVKVDVHTDGRQIGGVPSNRVMAGVRIAF
ncbi:hypothetical protein [Novosphingobium sp.]|uniref:hypothetical protein n=1 Tax=Novosphingobium sp. TaxID=1874826 RepID=UPI00352AECCA